MGFDDRRRIADDDAADDADGHRAERADDRALPEPSSTGVCCMISRALGKFHRSFVRNELIIIAMRTRMTARATQRPGGGPAGRG